MTKNTKSSQKIHYHYRTLLKDFHGKISNFLPLLHHLRRKKTFQPVIARKMLCSSRRKVLRKMTHFCIISSFQSVHFVKKWVKCEMREFEVHTGDFSTNCPWFLLMPGWSWLLPSSLLAALRDQVIPNHLFLRSFRHSGIKINPWGTLENLDFWYPTTPKEMLYSIGISPRRSSKLT